MFNFCAVIHPGKEEEFTFCFEATGEKSARERVRDLVGEENEQGRVECPLFFLKREDTEYVPCM